MPEVYKRTNYLTDDSDSDLDVVCDANKAVVPKGEKPESLLDESKYSKLAKKNPSMPYKEDLPVFNKAI